MAISWGAWEYSGGNGMRVGIDVDIEDVVHSTLGCTFTVRYYTENQYSYSDDQSLNFGGNITGSQGFHNGAGGAVVLRATKTHVYTYPTTGTYAYGESPGTRTFTVTLSGAFNGVTPSKSVTVTIPGRPIAAPNNPSSVALSRINDGSGKLTWNLNATDGRPVTGSLIQRSVNGGGWGTVYNGGDISSYTAALASNWKVRFQVRSSNSAGVSGFVASGYIWTTPAAPSNAARSGAAGANQVITWTNNAAYSEYQTLVERSVDGGAWTQVATVAGGTATWTDTTSTDPSKAYTYRVRAQGTAGNGTGLYSPYSTTTASPVVTNPPAAPSSIVRTLNGSGQPVLSWTNNATASAPYVTIDIQRRDTIGNVWETIDSVAGSATTYTDTSVGSNLKVEYQIRAVNSAGQSAYVGAGTFVWTKPAAPIDIQWVGVDTNADEVVDDFRVTWQNTAGYSEYQTEVWVAKQGVWEATARATLGSGVTQWTDVNPDKAFAWAYRVRHKATSGPSAPQYSAYVTSTPTSSLTRAPKAPVSLQPNSATVTKDPRAAQRFTWSFVPDDIDQSAQSAYEVQRRAAGGAWTSTGKVTSTNSWYDLPANTYTAGTTVEWQVRTYNAHTDPSDWSAVASFTMQLPPPPKQPRKRAIQVDLDTGNHEATSGRLPSTATGLAVVRAVATTNRSLFGPQTVDGVALVEGDRVLLTRQTNAAENGIWVVANADWVRGNDADTSAKAALKMVSVDQGSFGGTTWATNFKSSDTLGTTSMTWFTMLQAVEELPSMDIYSLSHSIPAAAWTRINTPNSVTKRGLIENQAGEIKIKTAGWYILVGTSHWATGGTSTTRRLTAITKNTAYDATVTGNTLLSREDHEGSQSSQSCSWVGYLNVGDVIRLEVYTSVALTVSSARLGVAMLQSLPGTVPVQFNGFTQSDMDPGVWTPATLQNGWTNFGGGWATAAYMKRNGVVYLKGLVKSGTNAASILTLPSGFRPAEMHMFACAANLNTETTGAASAGTAHTHPVPIDNSAVRVDVATSGSVAMNHSTASNGYVSLSGISFIADGS